jgi:hypothetical protein
MKPTRDIRFRAVCRLVGKLYPPPSRWDAIFILELGKGME